MKVSELIENLKKCPQDLDVMMYYDGSPRLDPTFAFLGKDYDGKKIVVLAELDDVYNYRNEEVFFKVESIEDDE